MSSIIPNETIPLKAQILVFKTDISSFDKIITISWILNHHDSILKWSLDREDIDNVLRIEARSNLYETEIISLLSDKKISCIALE